MRQIRVSAMIEAERESVWAVLADFGNISDWNDGVKTSYLTGAAATGVGAKRHCDLKPAGGLEETITEWLPNERMVVSVDSAKMLPIESGEVTFSLLHGGTGRTKVEIRYAYHPKFGAIGKLIGKPLDRQLESGFEGFLADLSSAAVAHEADSDMARTGHLTDGDTNTE